MCKVTLAERGVSLLAAGQGGLGGHLVVLVLVHVLRPDLDEGRVDAGPWRLAGVEREGDPTHLPKFYYFR